jgi:hypothetical protein
MLENARNEARRVSAQAENRCPLEDEQRRQVAAIVKEADAVAQDKAGVNKTGR